jgi:hypothetical protein
MELTDQIHKRMKLTVCSGWPERAKTPLGSRSLESDTGCDEKRVSYCRDLHKIARTQASSVFIAILKSMSQNLSIEMSSATISATVKPGRGYVQKINESTL